LDSSKIIAAIARLARKRSTDVQGHITLATIGLNSSFGLSALRSLLEVEASGRLPTLTVHMTVDEVVRLVSSVSTSISTPSPIDSKKSFALTSRSVTRPKALTGSPAGLSPRSLRYTPPVNLGMGMDMQEIASLPQVADLRSDVFYTSHFSSQELATAVLRPDPLSHLCGIFCAKEATKKSHPELLNLRMDQMSISHDENGRPMLNISNDAIPAGLFHFIISITHTSQVAAATCLSIREVN
jgi:holo-[acyl-carrier protein] synthase